MGQVPIAKPDGLGWLWSPDCTLPVGAFVDGPGHCLVVTDKHEGWIRLERECDAPTS